MAVVVIDEIVKYVYICLYKNYPVFHSFRIELVIILPVYIVANIIYKFIWNIRCTGKAFLVRFAACWLLRDSVDHFRILCKYYIRIEQILRRT